MVRIESPSSINTFRQCKRKYYYSYIEKKERKESIQTITGKVVHAAIEQFFNLDPSLLSQENLSTDIQNKFLEIFINEWIKYIPSLKKLEQNTELIQQYYNESVVMVNQFAHHVVFEIKKVMNGDRFEEAFEKMKPQTEVYLISEKHNVQGYIDAIHHHESGEVTIMDYKTSKKDEMSDEYLLQLSLYALMYREEHNQIPKTVGLHFLRHGTRKQVEVNTSLLEIAQRECENIKEYTTQTQDMKDYPKSPGPLCKWKSGQCDFYELCFQQRMVYDRI